MKKSFSKPLSVGTKSNLQTMGIKSNLLLKFFMVSLEEEDRKENGNQGWCLTSGNWTEV